MLQQQKWIFPNCAEILGTDFSDEMIETANKNLLQSGRKNKRSLNRISL
ncbi:MAG: hypothetical protein ACM67R_02110 [Clostridiales bacterium]|jgi:hypothetical protein